MLLISELRLDEAHAIIEAGTREAEKVSRNIRIWSMLRCRARLSAGQLADALAEAEATLDMSDEIGDGNYGYLNNIASYVLGDIALRTGDPAALRTARHLATALYGTASGCRTTRRLGARLTIRLDGGPYRAGAARRSRAGVRSCLQPDRLLRRCGAHAPAPGGRTAVGRRLRHRAAGEGGQRHSRLPWPGCRRSACPRAS